MAEAALCDEVRALQQKVTDAEKGLVDVSRMVLEETATRLLLKLDATPFRDKALRKSLITLVENLVPEFDGDDHPPPPPSRAVVSTVPPQPAVPSPAAPFRPAVPSPAAPFQPAVLPPQPAPTPVRSRKRSRRRESTDGAGPWIARCRLVVRDRSSGREWFVGTDGQRYRIVKHELASFRDTPCYAMEADEKPFVVLT